MSHLSRSLAATAAVLAIGAATAAGAQEELNVYSARHYDK